MVDQVFLRHPEMGTVDFSRHFLEISEKSQRTCFWACTIVVPKSSTPAPSAAVSAVRFSAASGVAAASEGEGASISSDFEPFFFFPGFSLTTGAGAGSADSTDDLDSECSTGSRLPLPLGCLVDVEGAGSSCSVFPVVFGVVGLFFFFLLKILPIFDFFT